MEYRILPATADHLPQILDIYHHARQYMCQQGNPNQWKDNHPAESLLRQDIAAGQLYVCMDAQQIAGVFFYSRRPDPTYARIDGGAWCNNEPYGVIHRLAAGQHRKGVASACFRYALTQCPNLRIDTHEDNIPMQRALEKNGFHRCGIIYLANGDARIAYHKVI